MPFIFQNLLKKKANLFIYLYPTFLPRMRLMRNSRSSNPHLRLKPPVGSTIHPRRDGRDVSHKIGDKCLYKNVIIVTIPIHRQDSSDRASGASFLVVSAS